MSHLLTLGIANHHNLTVFTNLRNDYHYALHKSLLKFSTLVEAAFFQFVSFLINCGMVRSHNFDK